MLAFVKYSSAYLGSIEAKNRVFLAPMTRARATIDHVPTQLMVEYYAARAAAGVLITEATGISREGLGWPSAPGIWSDEQVEAWKPVTEAVHAKGGKIVLQLWHMGRSVHSLITGQQPVSASATKVPVPEMHVNDGKAPTETARALEVSEIPRLLREFQHAAKNAIAAGFDGVQIHAANGYLIDQFLRDSSNFRADEYGGSIANRVRLLDQVVGAVVEAVGADRTAVRFSPNGDSQGVIDSDPEPLFTAAAEVLNKHHVAWLELREPGLNSKFGSFGGSEQPPQHAAIRKVFKGKLVLNQDYTRAQAEEAVSSGTADAISFGRPFITNPDFTEKLRDNLPILQPKDNPVSWWYQHGPEGYTDLSVLQ